MVNRIRVLEFVTSFCVGGTERQFLNLVEGLPRTDFEVHVACFRAEGQLLDEVLASGLPLRQYPMPSLLSPSAVSRLAALVRYLRRHRIDVLHATGLYPNVLGATAGRLAGTPVVITSVRDMGGMWNDRQKRLQRITARWADAVVTNAEAVAGRLRREGYPPGKIEVIHNGIVSAAPAARHPGPDLRRQLGIPAVAPLVGVICRLDRVKGLEDFIDAAALVARRFPQTRFPIIGGPVGSPEEGRRYAEELRRRAAALGLGDRVILTGAREDVPELLPELTLSVLPSHSEGLSNALLEAMAAGLPVVATRVGGNPEIVDDGATGLLVPVSDPPALADAVCRLLASSELAARLGRAGRAMVEARFTHERMVERMTALYLRLLARARSRKRGRFTLSQPQVDPR